MMLILAVAAGGAIGAVARLLLSQTLAEALGTGFPWGTFAANIAGGVLMGVIVEMLALHGQASQELRAFATTGVLGGFTTFSAFSLETVTMLERGDMGLAALYVAGSVVLAVGGLIAGLHLVRAFA